jgi:hypothetical protein
MARSPKSFIQSLLITISLLACACEESCDPCDLDENGNPTPACNDICTPDDLQLTECATDVIGFASGLLDAINAIQVPFEQRTVADMLVCPADTGAGEPGNVNPDHINIFSYVGALPKSCNRTPVVDDCADSERSNYWVSVVDDRRPGADPHDFRIIWGGHQNDYRHYGACFPDPNGFDNPAAGIPKLLRAVEDVDGDGSIGFPTDWEPNYRVCPVQNHVFLFRFFVPDGAGGLDYIEKGNIARVSNPVLAPPSLALPGISSTQYEAVHDSSYVAVDLTLKVPAGQVITAYIENNYNYTPWIQWKEPCNAP